MYTGQNNMFKYDATADADAPASSFFNHDQDAEDDTPPEEDAEQKLPPIRQRFSGPTSPPGSAHEFNSVASPRNTGKISFCLSFFLAFFLSFFLSSNQSLKKPIELRHLHHPLRQCLVTICLQCFSEQCYASSWI